MIPNASGKRDLQGKLYRYYTCGRAHKEKADCPVRHVSADLLELTVVEFLGALARHPEIVRETLASASTRGQADRTQLRARLAEIDPELARLQKRLGHVVEAIAAGGADVLGDELRNKAAAPKEDKQRLLVEREKIQQALRLGERDRFDAERLLAALARFREVLRKLSIPEQKDLVAFCVDRVELRASPAGDERPGLHQYVVRLKLHVARLVESLEEKIVVERNESRQPPPAQRAVTLEPRVVFRSWGRSPSAVIVAPFREEFREAKPAGVYVEEPLTVSHPLHRALAWQRKLTANPELTATVRADHDDFLSYSAGENHPRLAVEAGSGHLVSWRAKVDAPEFPAVAAQRADPAIRPRGKHFAAAVAVDIARRKAEHERARRGVPEQSAPIGPRRNSSVVSGPDDFRFGGLPIEFGRRQSLDVSALRRYDLHRACWIDDARGQHRARVQAHEQPQPRPDRAQTGE
jgi:hypothetical protein